jgi:membrane-associated phospholipid phosphatase
MEGTGESTEARSRPLSAATGAPPAREHWARDWGVVVVLGVLALAAFAMLGEDVVHHETSAFDDGVRRWVLAHRPSTLLSFFHLVTTIGSVTPMVIYALVGAVVLWLKGRPLVASTVLVAPAAAVVAYLSLKNVFARTRPSGIGNVIEGTYSFPSAHATTSSAICCTLAYVFWRERLVSGAAAILFAVLVPLLVGMSRVYLDVHWATDVAGGWSAGLFIAALSAGLYNTSRRFRSLRQITQVRT